MPANKDFYLARAAESARDAAETVLPNVRERCLRAEAAWRAMAERMVKSEAERKREAARAAEA